MPFINGRFYANPTYGNAVENARDSDNQLHNEVRTSDTDDGTGALENEPMSESAQQADTSKQQFPKKLPHTTTPESPAQNANRVYNETAGLRPTTKQGRGSAQDLHNGRVAMSHVIRNRQAHGNFGGVAPNALTHSEEHAVQHYPPARDAYRDSVNAASGAAARPDPTHGATQFYLDYGQPQPSWARRKGPIASYGPFSNPAGGGDVQKDSKTVIIRIY